MAKHTKLTRTTREKRRGKRSVSIWVDRDIKAHLAKVRKVRRLSQTAYIELLILRDMGGR